MAFTFALFSKHSITFLLCTVFLLFPMQFQSCSGRPSPAISSNSAVQQLSPPISLEPYHTVPGDLSCHRKSHQLTEPCMEKFTLRTAEEALPVWNRENCCKLPATAVCIKAKMEKIAECAPLLVTILATFQEQFTAHCPTVTCRI